MKTVSSATPLILVVDDEIDICLAILDFLEGQGYQVHTVETGRKALDRIHSSHGYSAVILDLGLPDIDGLTVLQGIRNVDPTLPVVILTARPDQSERITTLEHHAFAHLTKPYDRRELMAIVQRAVALKDLNRTADQIKRALTSSEAQRHLEQERAQTLLSESEERLHVALRAGHMGIWDWHIQTNHLIWSDEVAGLFGLTPETLNGTYEAYFNCIYPEDRALVQEAVRQTLNMDVPYEVQYRIVWPSGEIHWLISKGKIIRDRDGHPIRMTGTIQDMTSQKEIEIRLRDSQLFLSSILENIPNMIFVKDAEDLRFIRFNKAGEELLGYSRDALIGKTDYDFFPKEEADFYTAKDREVLSEKCLLDIPEEVIHTKFRGKRYLHTKKIPILTDEGHPKYLLGISEDITERKTAEAQANRLTRQNQIILSSVGEGIYGLDLDGLTTFVNPAAGKMLGYEVEELLGKPMHATIHHSKANGLPYPVEGCPICAVSNKRDSWQISNEVFWKKDRTPIQVDVTCNSLWEGDVIVGKVVAFRDITKKLRKEEVFREGAKRFRAIFDQAPVGIAIIESHSGRFKNINASYCQIVGYSEEEMLNQTFQDITHPDDLQADLDHMQQLLNGQITTFRMKKRYFRKNGQIVWVHLTCVPLWLNPEDPHLHLAMVEEIACC